MAASPPIDPRALWPLAYLSGRLGYRLDVYRVSHDRDVITMELVRDDVRARVDWFPRTAHAILSRDGDLLGIHRQFATLADALDDLV